MHQYMWEKVMKYWDAYGDVERWCLVSTVKYKLLRRTTMMILLSSTYLYWSINPSLSMLELCWIFRIKQCKLIMDLVLLISLPSSPLPLPNCWLKHMATKKLNVCLSSPIISRRRYARLNSVVQLPMWVYKYKKPPKTCFKRVHSCQAPASLAYLLLELWFS